MRCGARGGFAVALAAPAVLLALLAVGCGQTAAQEDGCVDVRVESASAPERRALGAASPYPADGMLASRSDELLGSQRARRAVAWQVLARVLEPVRLAAPTALPDATVPRFRTWYDAEDARRIFEHVYASMSADERARRARPSDAALEAAFEANLRVLEAMPAWTEARWADFLGALDETAEIGALGGLRRIAISAEAMRHVVRSYPEILRCLEEGAPPAFVDGAPGPRRLVREPLDLAACEARTLGPYWVSSGATLRARLVGEQAAAATLQLLGGMHVSEARPVCSARGDEGCAYDGPGAVLVAVRAARSGIRRATLEVDYAAPDVPLTPCLEGPFPLAAVSVAQHWQRVELGPMPTFDTSAEALARRLDGDGTWGEADGTADPGPDEIFTIRTASGATYRLAAMHVRTRELERWVNVTMWWTPDPEQNFGADRPSFLRALGGPWSHYAMCVAIDDVERDPDPRGDFRDLPSLGEALSVAARDGLSWCSNPYIDAAPGLARSNCVGCHQHGMSGVAPGEVVMDERRFPHAGRTIVRNNFPSDHFWGLDAGDDLAVLIADVVAYWNGASSP